VGPPPDVTELSDPPGVIQELTREPGPPGPFSLKTDMFLEMASAWSEIMSREAACRSASFSSAVCLLKSNKINRYEHS